MSSIMKQFFLALLLMFICFSFSGCGAQKDISPTVPAFKAYEQAQDSASKAEGYIDKIDKAIKE